MSQGWLLYPKRWHVWVLVLLWWMAALSEIVYFDYGQYDPIEELRDKAIAFSIFMAWAFVAALLGLVANREEGVAPTHVHVFWVLIIDALSVLVVDLGMPWLFFTMEWMRVTELELFAHGVFALLLVRMQLQLILPIGRANRFWWSVLLTAMLLLALTLRLGFVSEGAALPFVANIR